MEEAHPRCRDQVAPLQQRYLGAPDQDFRLPNVDRCHLAYLELTLRQPQVELVVLQLDFGDPNAVLLTQDLDVSRRDPRDEVRLRDVDPEERRRSLSLGLLWPDDRGPVE